MIELTRSLLEWLIVAQAVLDVALIAAVVAYAVRLKRVKRTVQLLTVVPKKALPDAALIEEWAAKKDRLPEGSPKWCAYRDRLIEVGYLKV